MTATSATTRLGTLAYHPELAVDDRQWYSRWCQSEGRHASAPPHCRKDHAHVSHRAGVCGQHGRWMWQGCRWWSLCLVRNVVAFNLGQDGIKRSSKDSAFYSNVPNCCVARVVRQYWSHNALIICTALFFGGFLLTLLILGQRRFPQPRAAFRLFLVTTLVGKSRLRRHCRGIHQLSTTLFHS